MNTNLQIGKLYNAKAKIDYIRFEKGATYRVTREDAYPNYVFVFFKGKRRFGLRLSQDFFFANFEVLPEKAVDKEKQWHDRLSKAIAYLEESGLWENIKVVYKNLLTMSYDDHEQLKNLPFNFDGEADALKEKYPFAFGIDEHNGKTFVKSDYVYELSDCRMKTMNFGKYDTDSQRENIKQAIAEGKDYDAFGRTSYDVSFRFDAERKRAYYSEEYKNCGNGHYYLALDNKHCVFCEND